MKRWGRKTEKLGEELEKVQKSVRSILHKRAASKRTGSFWSFGGSEREILRTACKSAGTGRPAGICKRCIWREDKKEAALTEKMRQLQEELDKRKEMLKKMGEEIEKPGMPGENRLSLYQKKNNLTVQLNQADRLIEAKEEQSSLQKKARIYNRTLFESKRKLSSGERSIRKEFRLFLDTQAGILAEGLEEGMACPVCGSVHHPALAEKCGEEISKESVDQKKAAADEAEKRSEIAVQWQAA